MYKDRHGRQMQPGQRIRVQVCVGRYGQTAIRQGVIVELHKFSGATIKTDEAFDQHCGSFGMQHRAAGSEIFVQFPPNGYQKFQDFEHGHETWVEIIE